MDKGRERQIILKTDQRTVLLEMGLAEMAARVLTHVPAGPRPAPPPAQHYFPAEE
jgi:hypothetical protein